MPERPLTMPYAEWAADPEAPFRDHDEPRPTGELDEQRRRLIEMLETPTQVAFTVDPIDIAPADTAPRRRRPEVERRRCPRCEDRYPATDEYFHRTLGGNLTLCTSPLAAGCYEDARAERSLRARVRRDPGLLRFGVEIEFVGDIHRVSGALSDHGIQAEGPYYSHETLDRWKIVTDASVCDGGELVSPPMTMTDASIAQIDAVCEALRAVGATVDRRCGLHVHLEVRGYTAREIGRVFRGWYNHQEMLDLLLPRSRRGDNARWCQHLDSESVELVEGLRSTARHQTYRLEDLERYMNLNGSSYPRYGTIEVRSHAGTLNSVKIVSWVRLCRALFERFRAGNVAAPDDYGTDALLAFLDDVDLPRGTRATLRRRVRQIAAQDEQQAERRAARASERIAREAAARATSGTRMRDHVNSLPDAAAPDLSYVDDNSRWENSRWEMYNAEPRVGEPINTWQHDTYLITDHT